MAEAPPILLVANFADRVGGGEESLLTLASGIDRRRFAPHAVVPGEGAVAAALREAGVPVAVVPLPPLRPWTLVAGIRTVRRLRALLAARGIRLAHAHSSRGALYTALAARRRGIPLVWHVRIVDRDPLLDGPLMFFSTRVIAVSEAVRGRFGGSRFRDKVRVVYNGVNAEYWTAPAASPPSGDGPVVLVVGRLMPEKGQATLLRAAPAVLSRVPSARFVLLGTDHGGERERLERLAQSLGIRQAVEIRSWIADPRRAYAEADVVAVPSRMEGFGRVLVEAGCLAKPVVASRVGGIPEVVVDGETGLLVPHDDPKAWAEALSRLLGDPGLRTRLGRAGRERALSRFSARRHVEGVEAVYAELVR
ncbi:MAG: glycosyltransferase family 4 protein [Candidatus Rokubacteria bacterium]|nr:glycosyltransferase family 4 protein [Candidatus Rokubacteria bacterium]